MPLLAFACLASDLAMWLALHLFRACWYICSFFVSQEERYNREVVLADGRTVSYSVAGNPDGLPVFLFLVRGARTETIGLRFAYLVGSVKDRERSFFFFFLLIHNRDFPASNPDTYTSRSSNSSLNAIASDFEDEIQHCSMSVRS